MQKTSEASLSLVAQEVLQNRKGRSHINQKLNLDKRLIRGKIQIQEIEAAAL